MLDRRYRAEVRYLSYVGVHTAVPSSWYGRTVLECATIAALVDAIIEKDSGEPRSARSAVEIMGYVVNGSNDPAVTIVKDGPAYGINPYDWLDVDVVHDTLSLLSVLYDEEAEEHAREALSTF